jgi:hypothetical protein
VPSLEQAKALFVDAADDLQLTEAKRLALSHLIVTDQAHNVWVRNVRNKATTMKEVFQLFEQEHSSASRQSNTMHPCHLNATLARATSSLSI